MINFFIKQTIYHCIAKKKINLIYICNYKIFFFWNWQLIDFKEENTNIYLPLLFQTPKPFYYTNAKNKTCLYLYEKAFRINLWPWKQCIPYYIIKCEFSTLQPIKKHIFRFSFHHLWLSVLLSFLPLSKPTKKVTQIVSTKNKTRKFIENCRHKEMRAKI